MKYEIKLLSVLFIFIVFLVPFAYSSDIIFGKTDNSTLNKNLVFKTPTTTASCIICNSSSGNGTKNHTELTNLDYTSSGHTGFYSDTNPNQFQNKTIYFSDFSGNDKIVYYANVFGSPQAVVKYNSAGTISGNSIAFYQGDMTETSSTEFYIYKNNGHITVNDNQTRFTMDKVCLENGTHCNITSSNLTAYNTTSQLDTRYVRNATNNNTVLNATNVYDSNLTNTRICAIGPNGRLVDYSGATLTSSGIGLNNAGNLDISGTSRYIISDNEFAFAAAGFPSTGLRFSFSAQATQFTDLGGNTQCYVGINGALYCSSSLTSPSVTGSTIVQGGVFRGTNEILTDPTTAECIGENFPCSLWDGDEYMCNEVNYYYGLCSYDYDFNTCIGDNPNCASGADQYSCEDLSGYVCTWSPSTEQAYLTVGKQINPFYGVQASANGLISNGYSISSPGWGGEYQIITEYDNGVDYPGTKLTVGSDGAGAAISAYDVSFQDYYGNEYAKFNSGGSIDLQKPLTVITNGEYGQFRVQSGTSPSNRCDWGVGTTSSVLGGSIVCYDDSISKYTDFYFDANKTIIRQGKLNSSEGTELMKDTKVYGNLTLINTVWDDVLVAVIGAGKPATNPFKVGAFRGNIEQPYFEDVAINSEENADLTIQIPHRAKQGSNPEFHCHGSTGNYNGTNMNVTFNIEYTCANITGTFPASKSLTKTFNLTLNGGGEAYSHNILSFGNLTGCNVGLSEILPIRIHRNSSLASDTFTNNYYLLNCDAHIEISRLGSDEMVSG